MPYIFVSYSRQSDQIARELVNDIKQLGHTVWYDQELSGGQTWWDIILETIRRCDVFVFILDQTALNSTACRLEYTYAADLGKLILPILVSDEVFMDRLPSVLSQIQFVDYRKPDRHAVVQLARAFTLMQLPSPLPDPLPLPPQAPISHLVSLTEQIEATASLNFQQQSALVIDLKKNLRDPKTADDAKLLLKNLRERHDLLATIADEIDDLSKSLIQAQSFMPNNAFKLSPKVKNHQITKPQLKNTILLRLIRVVIGVAIGGLIGGVLWQTNAYMIGWHIRDNLIDVCMWIGAFTGYVSGFHKN